MDRPSINDFLYSLEDCDLIEKCMPLVAGDINDLFDAILGVCYPNGFTGGEEMVIRLFLMDLLMVYVKNSNM